MIILNAEQIAENFSKFETLCSKTGAHRQASLAEFFDAMGQRLCAAPASSKVDFHNCFVGGLVEHSLRVLTNAIKISKTMEMKFSQEELIFSCLFHDIGKLGDLENERYIEQDDDYWRKKGNLYKVNPKLKFMTVPHNSVYLLQHFGIRVSYDEMMAILLNDGHFDSTNEPYKMKEPDLAVIVHQADLLATRYEKNREQGEKMKAKFEVALDFPDDSKMIDIQNFYEEVREHILAYRTELDISSKIDVVVSKKLNIEL